MRNGTTRIALIGLVVIGLTTGITAFGYGIGELSHTETFQALGPAPAYQMYLGPPRTAIFTNVTGEDVVGLRLTFSSPVPSLSGYGVAAEAALTSNEGMTAIFEGEISSYGGVSAEWDETDAKVLVARWLKADGSTLPVDLHQPFARMKGTASYAVGLSMVSIPVNGVPLAPMNGSLIAPQFEATFALDGRLSTTFDGTEIARYQWEWDDGFIQEGPTAKRTISMRLELDHVIGRTSYDVASVTLTVWGVNGSTSSVTKTFTLRVVMRLD